MKMTVNDGVPVAVALMTQLIVTACSNGWQVWDQLSNK